jgi:hypothetical protein
VRRQSQAFHTSGCQGLSEVRAELGIAVVQHIAMAPQISGFPYGQETRQRVMPSTNFVVMS